MVQLKKKDVGAINQSINKSTNQSIKQCNSIKDLNCTNLQIYIYIYIYIYILFLTRCT